MRETLDILFNIKSAHSESVGLSSGDLENMLFSPLLFCYLCETFENHLREGREMNLFNIRKNFQWMPALKRVHFIGEVCTHQLIPLNNLHVFETATTFIDHGINPCLSLRKLSSLC